MELSKITTNCAKSTQFIHPCPKSHEICTIRADFPGFSVSIGQLAKICDIRTLLYFRRFHVIHTHWETTQARANSVKSAININSPSLYSFRHSSGKVPGPCLSELRKFCHLKMQFAKNQNFHIF